MPFEEILPRLKNGEKIIRQGWGGAELYVKYVPATKIEDTPLNPYLVINVTGEGYTIFTPTICDILADDWEIVQ